MHGRAIIFGVVVLLAVSTGSTCKVVNEDHCANQDVPGNEFCRELNTATPYCSPCRREYHGCVDYEPFACEGYDNEIGQDDDGPSESSTSDAPASTSDASTGPGSTSGSSSDDSGSDTAETSG